MCRDTSQHSLKCVGVSSLVSSYIYIPSQSVVSESLGHLRPTHTHTHTLTHTHTPTHTHKHTYTHTRARAHIHLCSYVTDKNSFMFCVHCRLVYMYMLSSHSRLHEQLTFRMDLQMFIVIPTPYTVLTICIICFNSFLQLINMSSLCLCMEH